MTDEKPKEYTLRTIKDIFDKIPADRIEVCMKELTTLLVTSKQFSELMRQIGSDLAGQDIPEFYKMPEEFVWKDDGEGLLTSKFPVDDKQKIVMEIKRKPER